MDRTDETPTIRTATGQPWPLPKRIPGAALDRTGCPSLADRIAALESMERELRAGGAL